MTARDWLRYHWRACISLALVVGVMIEVAVLLSGQTTPPPPFPRGMRVIVGSDGSLPRLGPWGMCGTPAHACGTADTQPPGAYGVVEADAPILDTGGAFYWQRVTYEAPTTSGITVGWSRAIAPYLLMLTPPQMISGIPFYVMASYGPGPILTDARCINDGVNNPAAMQLQATTCCADNGPGQVGSLVCSWPSAGVGNHKVVIQAINSKGTAQSDEFQFAVTTVPQAQPPTKPTNMRIVP